MRTPFATDIQPRCVSLFPPKKSLSSTFFSRNNPCHPCLCMSTCTMALTVRPRQRPSTALACACYRFWLQNVLLCNHRSSTMHDFAGVTTNFLYFSRVYNPLHSKCHDCRNHKTVKTQTLQISLKIFLNHFLRNYQTKHRLLK